ncbi:MAG: hypothetical protein WA771_03370 [Chthoniobacterales bacterium]
MATALNRFVALLAKPALCVAVFGLIGGHLAAFQTVAWAKMIRDYSAAEGSVVAGVVKTFSGEAPCDLCERVEKARSSESQTPPALTANTKIDGLPAVLTGYLRPPTPRPHQFFTPAHLAPPLRSSAPPEPVPIVA